MPDWSRREWAAFGVMVSILAFAGVGVATYLYWTTVPCESPGCNIPESIFIDHYSIQSGSSQKPSLLTVWFRSSGSAGQTVSLRSILISNSSSTRYSFAVSGIMAANSLVPVTVDTSTVGFYFDAHQCYNLILTTDHYQLNFGEQICN